MEKLQKSFGNHLLSRIRKIFKNLENNFRKIVKFEKINLSYFLGNFYKRLGKSWVKFGKIVLKFLEILDRNYQQINNVCEKYR